MDRHADAHTESDAIPLGDPGRPRHERPYLLIPVGYPAPAAQVPDIRRKPLEDIRQIV
jgi:hypothetical protein